ncbi:MAG: methyl-accepting chemotaxis protein [Verrucomicrobiota bacterium]
MKISTRIYVLLGIITLAFLLFAFLSFTNTRKIADMSRSLKKERLATVESVFEIKNSFDRMKEAAGRAPSELNLEKIASFQKEFQDSKQKLVEILSKLTQSALQEEIKKQLNETPQLLENYSNESAKVFEFANSFLQKEAVDALTQNVKPIEEQLNLILQNTFETSLKDAGQMGSQMESDAQSAQNAVFITTIIVLVVVIGLGLMTARAIIRPIGSIHLSLHDIAQGEGDLTRRLEFKTKNEIGLLANSFNVFVEKLQKIMKEIHSYMQTLSASSEQLSSVSQKISSNANEINQQAGVVATAGSQLSSSVTTMAASAEEISSSANNVAAAVEEMSASINEVAQNCARESEIAEKAHQRVTHAREVMSQLGTAAQEIGKVVELINKLADQTNLLALNATIEAASAGEAGKGFAVVANEVKELARQSSQATEQISQQIQNIQSSTTQSVQAIEEVAGIIEEVNHISQSIVATIEEQSATTKEISKTVHGVSQATSDLANHIQQSADGAKSISQNIQNIHHESQQSATEIDHSNSSIQELVKVAAQLRNLINQFKI